MNWSRSHEDLDKVPVGSRILLRNSETKTPFTVATREPDGFIYHRHHHSAEEILNEEDSPDVFVRDWLLLPDNCWEGCTEEALTDLPAGGCIVLRESYDESDEEADEASKQCYAFRVYEKLVVLCRNTYVEYERKNGWRDSREPFNQLVGYDSFIIPE